jgi:hypothetical protein
MDCTRKFALMDLEFALMDLHPRVCSDGFVLAKSGNWNNCHRLHLNIQYFNAYWRLLRVGHWMAVI